jgi:hypothetical protein
MPVCSSSNNCKERVKRRDMWRERITLSLTAPTRTSALREMLKRPGCGQPARQAEAGRRSGVSSSAQGHHIVCEGLRRESLIFCDLFMFDSLRFGRLTVFDVK